MKKNNTNSSPYSSDIEKKNRLELFKKFKKFSSEDNFSSMLSLFSSRQHLSRVLFMHELYKKTLEVEGHIFEFGCKWGSNLSLFTALRGIYQPYHHNKKIFGFDTFSGLKGVSEKDYNAIADENSYATNKNWNEELENILAIQESFNPISHIKKYQIIKGDVRKTLKPFLKKNKHIIASLVYLDMDIYEPTKHVLREMLPFLTKGSIIVFDESNWEAFPGPTIALDEIFGKKKYTIKKSKYQPIPSYIIID